MRIDKKIWITSLGSILFVLSFLTPIICHASVPADKSQYFKYSVNTTSTVDWNLIKTEIFETTQKGTRYDVFPPASTDPNILIGGQWYALEKNYYLRKDFAALAPEINVSTAKKIEAWKKIESFFLKAGGNDSQAKEAITYIDQKIKDKEAADAFAGTVPAWPDETAPATPAQGPVATPEFTYSREAGIFGSDVFVIPNFASFISKTTEDQFSQVFLFMAFEDHSLKIPVDMPLSSIGVIPEDKISAWEEMAGLYTLIGNKAKTNEDRTAARTAAANIRIALGGGVVYLDLNNKTFAQGTSDNLEISLNYMISTSLDTNLRPSGYQYKIFVSEKPESSPKESAPLKVIDEGTFGNEGISKNGIYLSLESLAPGYYEVKALITDSAGKNFFVTETSAIRYFQITGEGATNPVAVGNTISLDKKTMKPGDLLSVTATFTSRTADQECYLYVGDGKGTYWLHSSNNSCTSLQWQSTEDSIEGWHTVAVTLVDAGDSIPGTITVHGVVPSPFVSAVVNVCKGTCSPVPTISLSVSTSAVKLPASGASFTKPKITAVVSNPTDPALDGKECYIYIGDQAGGWILKTKGSLSNCSLDWDYSGSSVNLHGFMANIQPAGLNPGNPALSPKSVLRYIQVCAANSTNCKEPAQPADPDNPTVPAVKPGTPTEPFDPKVSGNKLIDLAGIKTQLSTPEGIFLFLVNDFFPLIIGILAFVSIAIGGIGVMSSAGDPAAAEKGKKAIINGIIGMVAAILSYGIITAVVDLLKRGGIA